MGEKYIIETIEDKNTEKIEKNYMIKKIKCEYSKINKKNQLLVNSDENINHLKCNRKID